MMVATDPQTFLDRLPVPSWPFLERSFAGAPAIDWIVAAVVAIVVVGALLVARSVIVRRLVALSRRTATPIDDVLAAALSRTSRPFLFVVGAWVGASVVVLPDRPLAILGHAAFVAFLLQALRWGNTLIGSGIRAYVERETLEPAAATSMHSLGFVGRLVLGSVVVLVGLDHFGVNVTALVAGLGVGGVAVALAVQNILGDLFASMSIVLDKPFVVGDFILVGEHAGTVERVGLKTTRVRSLSGEQLVFSNSDLLSSRLRNFKRMQERRVLFKLGVTYDTPRPALERIPGIIREIIEAQDRTRFDRAHFSSYGDFALQFEVVYYVLSAEYVVYMDIQQAINLKIHEAFERDGIEFAFPTQTVHLVGGAGGGNGAGVSASDRSAP